MRKNKFLAALAIAACLATSVPFSASAATPGQATDASKVVYGTVSNDEAAVLKKLFNATYYKEQNPDLAAAGITTEDALFNHFVKCGIFEGRACCAELNVAAYKSAYLDLRTEFGDDIVKYYLHFQLHGKDENRAMATVEGALKNGVKIVSAVDNTTVVATGTTAAASTSTGAASSSSDSNASSGSSNTATGSGSGNAAASSQSTTNPTVPQTTSVSKTAKEAKLARNMDINYLAGRIYDYSQVQISKSKTDELKYNYVYADGAYHELVNYIADAKYKNDVSACNKGQWAGKKEWYDSTKSVNKSVATESGYDMTQWYTDNEIQYHKRDLDNSAYKKADGTWNLKEGFAAIKSDNKWFFFNTTGNRAGVNSKILTTTRILADNQGYVTVRRQSSYTTLSPAKASNGYTVYYGGTRYATRDAAEIAGLFDVSNLKGEDYVLQIGSVIQNPDKPWLSADETQGITIDTSKVLSYNRVTVYEACNPDLTTYGLIKNAEGVVTGAYKLAVEGFNTDDVWYCTKDYVYGTDGLYHKTTPDKKDRVAAGYTYYGTKKYLAVNENSSSADYGKYSTVSWDDACYINSTVFAEEALGRVPVIPDASEFVVDEVTDKYYPIVEKVSKAFKPEVDGDDVLVAQYTDKRYYYMSE